MSRTVVDLDDEALSLASEELGTTSKVATVNAALRRVGDRRRTIEGYEASNWVVQDYGDLVVHVFDQDTRDYYALEELWPDAPRVDWKRT